MQFFQAKSTFLGHIVSAAGILPDPTKIQVVLDWLIPENQTQLRGFLGLANYFSRFIPKYADISAPMEVLTGNIGSRKCCPFTWTPILNEAFRTLKTALTSATCLALPQWDKTFQGVVDASATGVGCVLMPSKRPIAYLSKRLNNAERNYSTSDRELLAAVK